MPKLLQKMQRSPDVNWHSMTRETVDCEQSTIRNEIVKLSISSLPHCSMHHLSLPRSSGCHRPTFPRTQVSRTDRQFCCKPQFLIRIRAYNFFNHFQNKNGSLTHSQLPDTGNLVSEFPKDPISLVSRGLN